MSKKWKRDKTNPCASCPLWQQHEEDEVCECCPHFDFTFEMEVYSIQSANGKEAGDEVFSVL